MATEKTTSASRTSSRASDKNGSSAKKGVRVKRRTTVTNQSANNGTFNTARIQAVMDNLDIRFVDCTFTYKPTHFEAQATPKKRSSLARLRNTISSTLDRVREAMVLDTTYNGCVFFPSDEEKVKNYIQKHFSDVKLSFVNCKFVGRPSTFLEQVTRKLRKIFSITFELQNMTATATVDQYTFRLKDVNWVCQQIQERIVEDE